MKLKTKAKTNVSYINYNFKEKKGIIKPGYNKGIIKPFNNNFL